MQVAKWGNSLAVRIPADVVEALQLKPGRRNRNPCRRCAPVRSGAQTQPRGPPEAPPRDARTEYPPISCSTGKRRMSGDFFDTNVLL